MLYSWRLFRCLLLSQCHLESLPRTFDVVRNVACNCMVAAGPQYFGGILLPDYALRFRSQEHWLLDQGLQQLARSDGWAPKPQEI